MSDREKRSALFFSVLCLLGLSSCDGPFTHKTISSVLLATSQGIFSRTDVNLKEKNYAAADFLYQRMNKEVTPHHTIIAVPLEEVDHAGITSPLGHKISEAVGLRLMELGYHNMWLHKVEMQQGGKPVYPEPPKGTNPDFILKGTYIRDREYVNVRLLVLETKTMQIVSSFEYNLPLSHEVRDLAKTQTQIYRVEEP